MVNVKLVIRILFVFALWSITTTNRLVYCFNLFQTQDKPHKNIGPSKCSLYLHELLNESLPRYLSPTLPSKASQHNLFIENVNFDSQVVLTQDKILANLRKSQRNSPKSILLSNYSGFSNFSTSIKSLHNDSQMSSKDSIMTSKAPILFSRKSQLLPQQTLIKEILSKNISKEDSLTRVKSYIKLLEPQEFCVFRNKSSSNINQKSSVIQLFVFFLPKIGVYGPNINLKILSNSLNQTLTNDNKYDPLVVLILSLHNRKCFLYLESFLNKYHHRPIHLIFTKSIYSVIHMDKHFSNQLIDRLQISVLDSTKLNIHTIDQHYQNDQANIIQIIYQSIRNSMLFKQAAFYGYPFNSFNLNKNSKISLIGKDQQQNNNNKFKIDMLSIYMITKSSLNIELDVTGLYLMDFPYRGKSQSNCETINNEQINLMINTHVELVFPFDPEEVCLFEIDNNQSLQSQQINNLSQIDKLFPFVSATWIHLNFFETKSVVIELTTLPNVSMYILILTATSFPSLSSFNLQTTQISLKTYNLQSNILIITNTTSNSLTWSSELTPIELNLDNYQTVIDSKSTGQMKPSIYLLNITNNQSSVNLTKLFLTKTRRRYLQTAKYNMRANSYIYRIDLDDNLKDHSKALLKAKYWETDVYIVVVFLNMDIWEKLHSWQPNKFIINKLEDCKLRKLRNQRVLATVCIFQKNKLKNENEITINLFAVHSNKIYEIIPLGVQFIVRQTSTFVPLDFEDSQISNYSTSSSESKSNVAQMTFKIFNDSSYNHLSDETEMTKNDLEISKNIHLFVEIENSNLSKNIFYVDSCDIMSTSKVESEYSLFKNGCYSKYNNERYSDYSFNRNQPTFFKRTDEIFRFSIMLNYSLFSRNFKQFNIRNVQIKCYIKICDGNYSTEKLSKCPSDKSQISFSCVNTSSTFIINKSLKINLSKHFTTDTDYPSSILLSYAHNSRIQLIIIVSVIVLVAIFCILITIAIKLRSNDESPGCWKLLIGKPKNIQNIPNSVQEMDRLPTNNNNYPQFIDSTIRSDNSEIQSFLTEKSPTNHSYSPLLSSKHNHQYWSSSLQNPHKSFEDKLHMCYNNDRLSSYSWPPAKSINFKNDKYLSLCNRSSIVTVARPHIQLDKISYNNSNSHKSENCHNNEHHNDCRELRSNYNNSSNTNNTSTSGTIGTICGSNDILPSVRRKSFSLQRWWSWIKNNNINNHNSNSNSGNGYKLPQKTICTLPNGDLSSYNNTKTSNNNNDNFNHRNHWNSTFYHPINQDSFGLTRQ